MSLAEPRSSTCVSNWMSIQSAKCFAMFAAAMCAVAVLLSLSHHGRVARFETAFPPIRLFGGMYCSTIGCRFSIRYGSAPRCSGHVAPFPEECAEGYVGCTPQIMGFGFQYTAGYGAGVCLPSWAAGVAWGLAALSAAFASKLRFTIKELGCSFVLLAIACAWTLSTNPGPLGPIAMITYSTAGGFLILCVTAAIKTWALFAGNTESKQHGTATF
jgi:hypothetical protein